MYPAMQKRRQPKPVLLADALAGVMRTGHTGVEQRYEAASQVRSLWAQVLPPELAQHCRVADLSAGLLTVEADSPSYMYELRISSHQLLEYLCKSCPAAKVRAIKVMLAH
jgi:predicted nucleic acid-binding Zn ribbon protein